MHERKCHWSLCFSGRWIQRDRIGLTITVVQSSPVYTYDCRTSTHEDQCCICIHVCIVIYEVHVAIYYHFFYSDYVNLISDDESGTYTHSPTPPPFSPLTPADK